MALNIWISHGEEWLALEKVSFNGVTKEITVNSGVTDLNIRSDVYSAWVRWFEREENRQYLPAMRFTGLDPVPGGFTGDTYFMINGWKLVLDPRDVAIAGALYSDDYASGYWLNDTTPFFPATVAQLTSSVVTTQNIVTGDLATVLSDLLPYLSIINSGVKKASILVPHTDDIDADIPPSGDIPDIYVLETETADPTHGLVWNAGGF